MKQHDLIINYLRTHKSITPIESFNELGITKLATRIGELKQKGYNIVDTWDEGVNRFGEDVRFKRYTLIREKNWSEEDLLSMNKYDFMNMFDCSDEEYEMEHKRFQEM